MSHHSQRKSHSFLEQLSNQLVGLFTAWPINIFLLPALGMPCNAKKALGVTLVFMAISIVRGYFFRRVFNWWHVRSVMKAQKEVPGPGAFMGLRPIEGLSGDPPDDAENLSGGLFRTSVNKRLTDATET